MIRIVDKNAFYLRMTGKTRIGEYETTLDMNVIDSLIVNFVRRGRIPQTYTIDANNRVQAYNSGILAKGVYGVEFVGYYNGQPWRHFASELFAIVDSDGTEPDSTISNIDVFDVTIYMKLSGDGVTADFVQAMMEEHNADALAHSEIRDEIPAKTSDLNNDAGFQTEQQVQQQVSSSIEATKINQVQVDVVENGGQISADGSVNGQKLNLILRNFKGEKGDKGDTGETGEKGEKGDQGDSAIFTGEGEPWSGLKNTTGQSTTEPMTQKAVTDELQICEDIDLSLIYANGFYISSNQWKSATSSFKMCGKHINVRPGEKYLITAANDVKTVLWIIDKYVPVNNASVTGEATIVAVGTTEEITIPSGMYHMYIQDNTSTSSPSQKYPTKVVRIKSSLVDATNWVSECGVRESLVKHQTLSEYGYADCPNNGMLKIDSTFQPYQTSGDYYTSDYISIPSSATHIYYDNLNTSYQDKFIGICITNTNHDVLWYHISKTSDTKASGVVDLSKYPTAAYVRFMPAYNDITAKVRIERIDCDDIVVDDVVNGADKIRGYGCFEIGNSNSASQNVQYLTSDTPCLEGGYIDTILGYFDGSGNCKINIGFKDQSDYLIIRGSFVISVVNGHNAIDVSARKIRINEGEYLFVNYHETGYKFPYFGADSSKTPQALYVNPSNQVLEQESGIYMSLAWSVNSHMDSVEELDDSVEEMAEVVERNTNDIEVLKNNRTYYISDEVTGDNYQIIVRNGVLSLRSTTFHKALFLGNSLTMPQLIPDWQSSWGMAATKQEYDYTHIVQEGLRAKDEDAVCTPLSFSAWERDFSTSISTLIGDNLTSDTDLVVIRLGENVPAANVGGFQSALGNLIDYIYSISPNAKVVITGVFWANSSKEAAIVGAAQAKGIDYIKISQFGITAYEEEVGHYVYGNDEGIHEITNSGVALHPSNKGMLAIANTILNAIGYEPVVKSYSLQEVTVGGVTGMMYVEDE